MSAAAYSPWARATVRRAIAAGAVPPAPAATDVEKVVRVLTIARRRSVDAEKLP